MARKTEKGGKFRNVHCRTPWLFIYQPVLSNGTHSVDQAGLKLRNLPASASQVLGLKA